MTKYRIDVRIVARISDIPVEITDEFQNLRGQLIAAANSAITERLSMLDIKGGRSGVDGFIDDCSVQALIDWNQQ